MDSETHVRQLGKIIGNLQSLEVALRAAIMQLDETVTSSLKIGALKVGDKVPEDPFTNYDSLGPTISKFNALVPNSSRIDRNPLVTLRDALAHGKPLSDKKEFPLTLIKFSKPDKAGQVTVEGIYLMTVEWFQEQIDLVQFALKKVGPYCG